MTVSRGTLLAVEQAVPETYDVGKGVGYMVQKSITVEGTPTEQIIRDGFWEAIKKVGDLPVYVKATLTYAGREWPWAQVVSKFDVEYQAVHMAEGSVLMTICAVIVVVLPVVTKFLLVLLGIGVATYMILKTEDVGNWLDEQGPAVGVGVGAGVILLAGLILLGGDKK